MTSSSFRTDRPDGERQFLAGPRGRLKELGAALGTFVEFIRGYRALHFLPPAVTVFGSARFGPDHRYYALGRAVGAGLAKAGFTVMTGGGPGIMEAANRGAHESGGLSIGVNIKLPREQAPNPYLDRMVEFEHFFVRKAMLIKYSYAFITLPGGFGTMDEVFETATLIQTGKIRDFPIVLMGREFWAPLLGFLEHTMVGAGTIERADFDRFLVTDDVDEAVQHVQIAAERRFGLKFGPQHQPRAWLGERGITRKPSPVPVRN